jgi:hypothetical protein
VTASQPRVAPACGAVLTTTRPAPSGSSVAAVPTPVLFAGLVDDAGLFPPSQLPMVEALARHRMDQATGNEVLSHRFVCPASRLEELVLCLRPDDRLALSLIVSPLEAGSLEAASRRVGEEPRLELAGIEGVLSAGVPVPAAKVPGVPVFAELPVTGNWRSGLEAVVAAGGRAGVKIRCGGMTRELFPSASQLADVLCACAAAALACKATAGLHHAVRYRDEKTGFEHHGFLNLLLAAARAAAGAGPGDVAAVLCSSDAGALVREALEMPARRAERARALLVSYGSCSTSEPVEDLLQLGCLGERLPGTESVAAGGPEQP